MSTIYSLQFGVLFFYFYLRSGIVIVEWCLNTQKMKTLLQIGLFVWLFSISLNCLSQGKIDKSKDELKKGSKSSDRPSNKSSSFSSGRSDDSFEFFIFRMFAEAFLFVTYNTLIGSYEKEGHLHNELTNSPFYDGFAGNYVGSGFDPPSTKNFRIDLDNKLLYYNDKLFGNHLKAKIRPIKYFYFQTDFVQWNGAWSTMLR